MRSEFGSDSEGVVDEDLGPEPERAVGIDWTCGDDEKIGRLGPVVLFPLAELWQELPAETALRVPEHEQYVSTAK